MVAGRNGVPTYLVTGGAGFIGSHLVDALLARGYRVRVIDDLSTGRLANIEHLAGHLDFHFVEGNITDEDVLDDLAERADGIFHLAAVVGTKQVLERPVHTVENNVMSTNAVLKAALRHGCRTLISSTSEVYGKGSKFPFSEEDDVVLGPASKSRWGYAASKMVDEFLGLAYQQEYGLPVVPFRLFNTVGPRQTGYYGMVVPRFVEQALRDEPITVYGDGQQSRTFTDVRDAVRALIGLAEHPDAPGRVYNIGGTWEITIAELAERVKALAESRSKIVYVPYSEAYEVGSGTYGSSFAAHGSGYEDIKRRVPDTRRIRALLGWKPEYSLEDTLARVIDSVQREMAPCQKHKTA